MLNDRGSGFSDPAASGSGESLTAMGKSMITKKAAMKPDEAKAKQAYAIGVMLNDTFNIFGHFYISGKYDLLIIQCLAGQILKGIQILFKCLKLPLFKLVLFQSLLGRMNYHLPVRSIHNN